MRYGKTEFGSPSRFLKDIDVRYLRLPGASMLEADVSSRAGMFRRGSSQYGDRMEEASLRSFVRPTVIQRPANLRRLSPGESMSGRTSSGNVSGTVGLRAGQYIRHERFGRGQVLRVDGEGENAKATIRFENAGEKQLLLRFARFTIDD